MAIQMRRDIYAKFNPNGLYPGEWAVALSGDPNTPDGKAVYICLAAGDVRRISTVEEITAYVDNLTEEDFNEIRAELESFKQSTVAQVTDAKNQAQAAASQANDAKDAANTAAENAAQATETANDASDRAEAAIDAIGDISELAVPLMSADTRGGAMQGDGLKVSDGALSIGDIVTDSHDGPIYSAHGEGWAEQDGTPTPENPVEIRVARGRNLFPGNNVTLNTPIPSGTVLVASDYGAESTNRVHLYKQDGTQSDYWGINVSSGGNRNMRTFATIDDIYSLSFDSPARNCQLELGSTPTPYVPYGHVGLEVRDSSRALISCKPIPLPLKSDGERWAGGLPDSTTDVLTLDSAGKWVWENESDEVVFDGSSSENWISVTNGLRVAIEKSDIKKSPSSSATVGILCSHFVEKPMTVTYSQVGISSNDNALQIVVRPSESATTVADWTAWLQSNPVTVLYPLATPTTEHGYIDLPDVPEGATIDIPELREVGVKCFVAGARELAEHAANWGKRSRYEDEQIEDAIADLATRVAALES